MKKFLSILLICLCLIPLSFAFVACDGNGNSGGGSGGGSDGGSNGGGYSYTATFDTRGGEEIEDVSANVGKTVTLPTPKKAGFMFRGWYKNQDLSGNNVTSVKAKNGSDKFYAKWESIFILEEDSGCCRIYGIKDEYLLSLGFEDYVTITVPKNLQDDYTQVFSEYVIVSTEALNNAVIDELIIETDYDKIIIEDGAIGGDNLSVTLPTIGRSYNSEYHDPQSVFTQYAVGSLKKLTYTGPSICDVNKAFYILQAEVIEFADTCTLYGLEDCKYFYGCRAEQIIFNATLLRDNGQPQTTTGAETFAGCTSLKSITIPKEIKTIGDKAFSGCTALETLNFKESSGLEVISYNAFDGCSALKSVEFPNSLKELRGASFANCASLESVVLNQGLELLGEKVFYYTNIQELKIPSSVASLGFGFITGSPIEDITFEENNKISIIKSYTFQMCENLEVIDLSPLKALTEIEDNSFSTFVKTIKLPSSITTLGDKAFEGAGALESVVISGDLSNSAIKIEDNILYSDNGARLMLAIAPVTDETFTVPNTVAIISSYAFKTNTGKFKNLIIPASVKEIGEKAFYNCSAIESITLNEGLETIGGDAFAGTSIEEFSFPASVTSFDVGVLAGCKQLKSVEFDKNNNITEMNPFLMGCTSLEVLRIPFLGQTTEDPKHTSIHYLFTTERKTGNTYYEEYMSVSKKLHTLEVYGGGQLLNYSFAGVSNLKNLYLGASIVNESLAYQQKIFHAAGNDPTGTSILMFEHVTAGFTNGITTKSFHFLSNQEEIDTRKYLFTGMGIEHITFSACITAIPSSMFAGDTKLKTVSFEAGSALKIIRDSAFNGCTKLEEFEFVEGLQSIKNRAFYGCAKLNINIPSTLTEIANEAFSYTSIKEVNLGVMSSFNIGAFSYCENLEEINISENDEKYCSVDGVLYSKDKSQLLLFPSKKVVDVFEISDTISTITSYAFYKVSGIKHLKIASQFQLREFDPKGNITGVEELTLGYDCVYTAGKTIAKIFDSTRDNWTNSTIKKVTITGTSIPSILNLKAGVFNGLLTLEEVVLEGRVDGIATGTNTISSTLKTVQLDSATLYTSLTSKDACEGLIKNATTIKVLKTVVDDSSNTNEFLNNSENYTKTESGDYYIYTLVV